ILPPPPSPLFPYTTLFRSRAAHHSLAPPIPNHALGYFRARPVIAVKGPGRHIEIKLGPVSRHLRLKVVEYFFRQSARIIFRLYRSEEHTSELQSQSNLVCR